MRTQRILVSLLTVALIGLVPIGFASSAEAARAKREVSATGRAQGDRFVIKGKVKNSRHVRIIVQERIGRSKKWRPKKMIRSNAKGKYAYHPPFGRVGVNYCYRFVIPGNKRFRRAFRATYTYGSVRTRKGPVPARGRAMCVRTRRP